MMHTLTPTLLTVASGSQVRSSILTSAGIAHERVPASISERALEAELGPVSAITLASALARAKAADVARHRKGLVLGADQTLALDGELLHKAENLSAARAQLMKMRGKAHELHSALCLCRDGIPVFEYVSTARLYVREFGEVFLDNYLAQAGETLLSSVGCYQIEGLGIQLFDQIEGDQFTIMGLPIVPLLQYLRRSGYLPV